MSSGTNRFISGSAIASGATQQILTVGFLPRSVKVVNITHPGELLYMDPMPADSGLKTVTNGTKSYITSLGITPLRGVSGAGFQLGADAAINQAGDVLYYEARE